MPVSVSVPVPAFREFQLPSLGALLKNMILATPSVISGILVPEAGVANSTTMSAGVANPATESSGTLVEIDPPCS